MKLGGSILKQTEESRFVDAGVSRRVNVNI
jgi:hypothetical protein